MTRRLALAALLVLAAGGGLALAVLTGSNAASAHVSDCHAARTCPADDGTYPWTDPAGLVWVCFARNPDDLTQVGATEIVHEGLVYACRPPDPATTGTTATETTPTETTPTESTPTSTTPTATTATLPVPTVAEPSPTVRVPAIPGIRFAHVAETPIGPLEVLRAQEGLRAAAARRARKAAAARAGRAPVLLPPGGIVPRLTRGRYVFPVYGPAAFVDTFGAGRATTGWHHGEDIFAPLGAPVLAVADGTLFSVGWNDVGGNRLWLRDTQGNEFYYAHLSAFSPLAVNNRPVRAGEVVGFVGTTGDADGTPPHLHFEIHPLGLLSLGYDGVVAPFTYLVAWKRLTDLAFTEIGLPRIGWKSLAPTSVDAPTPGALLLSSADISSAGSLEAEEVRTMLADEPAALAGDSPLTAAPAAPETPAAGPPIGALGDPQDAAALLAELRRQAEQAAAAASPSNSIWDVLAVCEASSRWAYNGSSGFDGGLQFHPETWTAYRLPAYPAFAWQATRVQQIAVGKRVLAEQGWQAWPVCSRRLGLR